MDNQPPELQNKVIILNGFANEEIARIMGAVKPLFDKPRDLIFAKTTEHSVEMKLKDLIVDISQDHEYLKNNPPTKAQREAHERNRAANDSPGEAGARGTPDAAAEPRRQGDDSEDKTEGSP